MIETINHLAKHGTDNYLFLIGGTLTGAFIDYLLSSSIGSHEKVIPLTYKNPSFVDKEFLNKCFIKNHATLKLKHKIECEELNDQPGHFECTEHIGYAYKLAKRKGLISDDDKYFIQKNNFQFHFNSYSYEENHNMSITSNTTKNHDYIC